MPDCSTAGCQGCSMCMADGGEVPAESMDVMPDDSEMDDALTEAAAGELLDAIQAKDKGGILEAIRAIVLSTR